jgi:hypothetical protein
LVEPAVDLGRLEQVFVLLRRGPQMDLLFGPNRPEEDLDGPIRMPSADASPSAEGIGRAALATAPMKDTP